MKILYGVQATGNGHISRSRIMAKYFKQHNVDVTYLFSGRDPSLFFDMDIFGDYICHRGLTFSTKNGKVNYLKSIHNNNFFKFLLDVYRFNLTPYDLIITDFEPLTAWAALKSKKYCLGIGHQYAFGVNTPIADKSFIAIKIMRYFAPVKQSIGLHWSPYHDNVCPPIIDINIKKVATDYSILVYLPFENQQFVTQILTRFSNFYFIIYSPELKDGQQDNISFRKTSYQGFKNDLKKAHAVICNSGFELNSECLHLGIPILTKPIKGQMEQVSNAFSLQTLGYAQVMHHLDKTKIEEWLENLPNQKQQQLPDVAKEVVNWIIAGRPISIEKLAQQFW